MGQPKTMRHEFELAPLRTHFSKTPNSAQANKLIDQPGDVFSDTEDELSIIAASLWHLSVRYDKLPEAERAKDQAALRKMLEKWAVEAVGKYANKVEPPFKTDQTAAQSIELMEKDVMAMMDELLAKTLPPVEKKVDNAKPKAV